MTSNPRKLILHIITGLGDGGAEAVLYRLVSQDSCHRHSVISLSGPGKYAVLLQNRGIDVHAIEMSPSRPSPIKMLRLVRLIRKIGPDVVQTWMYHGDLLGGAAAKIAGKKAVVWGLHNTTHDKGVVKLRTRVVIWLNARLSRFLPEAIISCSQNGVPVHQELGYSTAEFCVVHNGYDLAAFQPNKAERARIREEWQATNGTVLFGCVARYDPQKDHPNLLAAFSRVVQSLPKARLVLIGSGMTSSNDDLVQLINLHGLQEYVILGGQRPDIHSVMNGLDVHVLGSAYGEAFPNVLCEAMACGTPCVATDVGDCSIIVGETGQICPPSDPVALSRAMQETAARRGVEPNLAAACRARIMENFSVEKMVNGYASVWQRAAS